MNVDELRGLKDKVGSCGAMKRLRLLQDLASDHEAEKLLTDRTREVLETLRDDPTASMAQVGDRLGMTGPAVRQHLGKMAVALKQSAEVRTVAIRMTREQRDRLIAALRGCDPDSPLGELQKLLTEVGGENIG